MAKDTIMLIGAHLRTLRKARGLTLLEIARRSGVDQATISRIETGKMVGTLECHRAIARAMGLTLAELYQGLDQGAAERVTVQAEPSPADRLVHQTGRSAWQLLTRDVLTKRMMPVLMTVEPRGSTAKDTLPFGSERFVYVLSGQLQLQMARERLTIAQGQTVYFEAHTPHTFKNPSGRAVKCLVVTTPPTL